MELARPMRLCTFNSGVDELPDRPTTSEQRCDSVLLNRLRIGHIRLTHSFLLSGDDLPEYVVLVSAHQQ